MTMGGVAHGIGAALYEEFAYDGEGQMVAQSFMDYLLPSSHEVPPVEIIEHETPSPNTVLGQKGSGESGYLGAPAAMANAINDALRPLGVSINTLPLKVAKLGDLIAEAQEKSKRMIVDCHAHLVPPDLLAAIRKDAARFPNVRLIEDGGSLAFSFAGAKPTRPVSKPLSDIPARVAWMQEQSIDKQVVGGWVDMFGYELPGAEGEAWSRLINDHLLDAARSRAALRAARQRAARRRASAPPRC